MVVQHNTIATRPSRSPRTRPTVRCARRRRARQLQRLSTFTTTRPPMNSSTGSAPCTATSRPCRPLSGPPIPWPRGDRSAPRPWNISVHILASRAGSVGTVAICLPTRLPTPNRRRQWRSTVRAGHMRITGNHGSQSLTGTRHPRLRLPPLQCQRLTDNIKNLNLRTARRPRPRPLHMIHSIIPRIRTRTIIFPLPISSKFTATTSGVGRWTPAGTKTTLQAHPPRNQCTLAIHAQTKIWNRRHHRSVLEA